MSTSDSFVRRLKRSLDRMPFRRKLNILVVVPLLLIGALISVNVEAQVSAAQDAGRQADLVRASQQVAELVDLVQTEQQQALLLSERWCVRTCLGGPSLYDMTNVSPEAYVAAGKLTDEQVAVIRRDFSGILPAAEAEPLAAIDALATLRQTITEGYLPADNIDSAYGTIATDLIDGLHLTGAGAVGTDDLADQLDALLRADAAHARWETGVISARTGDDNAQLEFVSAVGSQSEYEVQSARFAALAGPAQAEKFAVAVDHNPNQATLDQAYAGLEVNTGSLIVDHSDTAKRKQHQAAAASLQGPVTREASARLAAVHELINEIAASAQSASNSSWGRAFGWIGGAVVVFVLWALLLTAIRRALVRSLLRLTSAARRVADVASRELARVADDDAEDNAPVRLEAVAVDTDDEIGALAVEFNRVQETAGALLERQVLSRRNIAEMFGNVGRRVSNLTTRQLGLIDAVERSETDPELLEQLYRIDHIAVRLQRNADSLMLLAGIQETELDGRTAPLTHVVRAALGQIEGFQRVRLAADTDAEVAPDLVGDLVLMLAELLENAVAFSPAHTEVEVSVREQGGLAVLEVIDHGLGMTSERLAEENARLVRRERLDLVPTRVLGLFVVGTLARRWGVTVSLSRTPGGGVTARVTAPAQLLAPMADSTPTHERYAPPREEQRPPLSYPDPVPPVHRPDPEPAPVWGSADRPAAGLRAAAVEHPPAGSQPWPDHGAERELPVRQQEWHDPGLGSPHPVAGAVDTTPQGLTVDALPRRTPGGSGFPGVAPAPAADAASPSGLRRRVRGATLRGGAPGAPVAARTTPQAYAPPRNDAAAVRDELEAFEAAVAQAHQDTQHNLRIPADPYQAQETTDHGRSGS